MRKRWIPLICLVLMTAGCSTAPSVQNKPKTEKEEISREVQSSRGQDQSKPSSDFEFSDSLTCNYDQICLIEAGSRQLFDPEMVWPQRQSKLMVFEFSDPDCIGIADGKSWNAKTAGRGRFIDERKAVSVVEDKKLNPASTASGGHTLSERSDSQTSCLCVVYERNPAAVYEITDAANGLHSYTSSLEEARKAADKGDSVQIAFYAPLMEHADGMIEMLKEQGKILQIRNSFDPVKMESMANTETEVLCASAASSERPVYLYENEQTGDRLLLASQLLNGLETQGLHIDDGLTEANYWKGSDSWIRPAAPEGYTCRRLVGYALYISDQLAGRQTFLESEFEQKERNPETAEG